MSYDSGPEWQEEDGSMHRRVDGGPTRSRSGDTQRQPQPGYQPPAPAPAQKKHTARNISLSALGVLVVCIIIGAATSNSSSSTPTAGAATSPEPSWPSPYSTDGINWASPTGDTSYTDIPIVPPPTSAPVLPDQVTFHCTGSAPDGVDITYGGEGTDDSASHLPFKKTVALSSTVQYYAVQAQLQGGGKVTCTTTVRYQGDSVTQTGEASGGYNIASAEVCSSFDGTWDAC
jgi:hypothetical protein